MMNSTQQTKSKDSRINKADIGKSRLNLPLTITVTGMALPNNVVTSEMIDKRLGKADGYVKRRSGINQRYHSFVPFEDKDTPNQLNQNKPLRQSELAMQAVKNACEQAGFDETDIDLLIAINAVPEQAIPCTASLILKQLNWSPRISGFDINASCIGILPALMTASSLLAQGVYQRIVIVACELASHGLNWQDEESSFIFGDGACAMIVQADKPQNNDNNQKQLTGSILAYDMQSFTDYSEQCQIKAGGTARNVTTGCEDNDFYFAMDGKPLFRMVAQKFPAFIQGVLDQAGLSVADVDLWIPHQASHLGLKHMVSRMGLDKDKVINIYENYGNQVSASLPIALHSALESGKLKQGQTVVLLGTGAGVSFGAMVWKV